jgi:hypothetical protein
MTKKNMFVKAAEMSAEELAAVAGGLALMIEAYPRTR